MVQRPPHYNVFEFVVVSGLRAAQLSRGCLPRVAPACKHSVTAQLEVAGDTVAWHRPSAVSEDAPALVPATAGDAAVP